MLTSYPPFQPPPPSFNGGRSGGVGCEINTGAPWTRAATDPPFFTPFLNPRSERNEEKEKGREGEAEGDGEREREREMEGETRPTRVRAGPLRITNPQKPSRLRCCLTATAVATTLRTFTLTLRRFKAMYPYYRPAGRSWRT